MVPENVMAEQAVRKGNVGTGDRRRQRTKNAASANRGSSAIGGKANAQHKQRKLGKRVVQDSTRRAHHYGNAEEHRELLGAEGGAGAAAFFATRALNFDAAALFTAREPPFSATSVACQRRQRFGAVTHKSANHHQQHSNAKHAQACLVAAERKRQQRNRPNKSNRFANRPNAPD